MDVESFDILLDETYSPIVVKFEAPWCGPCKALTPILDSLKSEFSNRALFVTIDVDAVPDLARRHRIRSVPTLAVFKRGSAVATRPGLLSKEQLHSWLSEHI